jgi:hypothetical protein
MKAARTAAETQVSSVQDQVKTGLGSASQSTGSALDSVKQLQAQVEQAITTQVDQLLTGFKTQADALKEEANKQLKGLSSTLASSRQALLAPLQTMETQLKDGSLFSAPVAEIQSQTASALAALENQFPSGG